MIVLLVALLMFAQQPPTLLEQALKTEPGLTVLKGSARPAWLEADFDRDKRPDVAAVVVRGAAGRQEFGVVAVHAAAPGTLEWVVPLDADPIHGLQTGHAPDTIVPFFCTDCDTNIWLRWSGEEYEAELHAAGERVDVGSETQADVPLYTAPNLASKPAASVEHCSTVTVLKVGGTPDRRWYFVESATAEQGWVPDTVTSADICVG